MAILIGQVGVFAARHADEAGRREPDPVPTHCRPMAVKIAMNRDWDLTRNVHIALKGHVRVSYISISLIFIMISDIRY